jgi:hypothetical protein
MVNKLKKNYEKGPSQKTKENAKAIYWLNIIHNRFAIDSDNSFNNLGCRLSGPRDLSVFSVCRTLSTIFSVTVIACISC